MLGFTMHNPVLSALWALIGVVTIIFAGRAVASLLPRPPWDWRHVAGFSAFSVIAVTAAFGAGGKFLPLPGAAAAYQLPPAPYPGAPLGNDASAGSVTFTFDDGPDAGTGQVIAELNALHLHGVFFVIGDKAAKHPDVLRAEMAYGEVVGNHTWDHRSFTGKGQGVGTGGPPLTQAQVRSELTRTTSAITAAGVPAPTLWRPPYGAVSPADDAAARSLGLRVVLDSGNNITDSDDWAGLTARQIAARVEPRLQDGTIVAFHDGLPGGAQAVKALPLIVAYMNARHLGETADVRPDATGGVVPYTGPPLRDHGTWPVPPAKRHPVPWAAPAVAAVPGEASAPSMSAAAAAAPAPSPSRPARQARAGTGGPGSSTAALAPAPASSTSTTDPPAPAPAPSTSTTDPPAPAPAPSTADPSPAPSTSTTDSPPAPSTADPSPAPSTSTTDSPPAPGPSPSAADTATSPAT